MILLAFSRFLYRFTERLHWSIVIGIAGVLYLLAYIQRFKGLLSVEQPIAKWFLQQAALLGTSLFPYITGMLFRKHRVISAVRTFAERSRLSDYTLRWIGAAGLIGMMMLHRFAESLFVAVFIAPVTIIIFSVCKKGVILNTVLDFLGKHSANIWLTHMFFYLSPFKDLVFIARYPILILPFLLVLCIGTSYLIQWIQKIGHILCSFLLHRAPHGHVPHIVARHFVRDGGGNGQCDA